MLERASPRWAAARCCVLPPPSHNATVRFPAGQLRAILMDPDMKRVMQACANPAALQQLIRHPVYGPKLRKLVDAGLMKFA